MLFNLNLDMEVVATATGLTRDEITMLIEEVGAQEEKFKIARNMLFNLHLESQIVVEATGLSVEAVLDLTPSSSGS